MFIVNYYYNLFFNKLFGQNHVKINKNILKFLYL